MVVRQLWWCEQGCLPPLPSQEVIDLCLDMLRSADATASSKEEGSMLQDLEGQCRQMRPLVEAKIAGLER